MHSHATAGPFCGTTPVSLLRDVSIVQKGGGLNYSMMAFFCSVQCVESRVKAHGG